MQHHDMQRHHEYSNCKIESIMWYLYWKQAIPASHKYGMYAIVNKKNGCTMAFQMATM